jgi:hypothetical protein
MTPKKRIGADNEATDSLPLQACKYRVELALGARRQDDQLDARCHACAFRLDHLCPGQRRHRVDEQADRGGGRDEIAQQTQ